MSATQLGLVPLGIVILSPVSAYVILKLCEPFIGIQKFQRKWVTVSYVIMVTSCVGFLLMMASR
jgi:hypothetical protein